MNARTLILLVIVGLIVGYAAYRSSPAGDAITAAALVSNVLYFVLKDDNDNPPGNRTRDDESAHRDT